MFLRSCASAFRQYVKTTPRPLLSRTILTNRHYCSSDETNETKQLVVDTSKSVTLVFHKSGENITKEKGFVGERIYDVIERVDKDKDVFVGYGICGGANSCGTCCMIMNENDFLKLEPPMTEEEDMIDQLSVPGNIELVRLGCKVRVTEEMEGMILHILCPKDVRLKSGDENKSSCDDED